MKGRRRESGQGEITFGLLMMAAGLALVLDQQGVLEVWQWNHWWPLVLVILGTWKIASPPEKRDAAGGAMLVVIGAWILACTHEWMGLTYRNSWPLILVAFGAKMVIEAITPVRPASGVAAGKESNHD